MFRRYLRHLRGTPPPDLKLVFVRTKSVFLGAINEPFNPIKMHGISYLKIVCQYCPLPYNVVHFSFKIVQYFSLLSNILQYCPVLYSIIQGFITTVIYLMTISAVTITEYR
jgi:hypothetical protein